MGFSFVLPIGVINSCLEFLESNLNLFLFGAGILIVILQSVKKEEQKYWFMKAIEFLYYYYQYFPLLFLAFYRQRKKLQCFSSLCLSLY